MDLELIHAQWTLERIAAERLPDLACDALQQGLDTPSLRELAGLVKPTMAEAGPVFQRVLAELGRPRWSPQKAALILARRWARKIVDHKIPPYEGAKAIVDVARSPGVESAGFFAFVRLASEIEDYRFADQSRPGAYHQSIRECEEAILDEAEKLLSN